VWVKVARRTISNARGKAFFSDSSLRPDFDLTSACHGNYLDKGCAEYKDAFKLLDGDQRDAIASTAIDEACTAAQQGQPVSDPVYMAFMAEEPLRYTATTVDAFTQYSSPHERTTAVRGVVLDGSYHMIIAVDCAGLVVDYNLLMELNCIASDDESLSPVIGRDLETFTWDNDLVALQDAAKQAMDGPGQSVDFSRVNMYHRDGNGLMYTVGGKVHPWYNEDIQICGAIYEMTDITASIFTDDTLDAILTSETLAAAMELDALGNIKQLNTLASALLGTEAVGMPLLELLPVSQRAELADAIQNALNGIEGSALVSMDSPSYPGGKFSEKFEVTPRKDALGNIVGVTVMQLPPAALTVDEDGKILEISDAAAALIGLDADQIIGQDFMSMISNADQPGVFDALLSCLDGSDKIQCLETESLTWEWKGSSNSTNASLRWHFVPWPRGQAS